MHLGFATVGSHSVNKLLMVLMAPRPIALVTKVDAL